MSIRWILTYSTVWLSFTAITNDAISSELRDRDAWCGQVAATDSPLGATTYFAQFAGLADDTVVSASLEPVTIGTGMTIADALKANNFLPDETNVKLVAYLNPTLADPDNVSPGQRVFIPRLETLGTAGWEPYVPANPIDGFALDNRVAPNMRKALIDESRQLSTEIANLTKHQSVSVRNKIILENYSRAYELIESPEWVTFSDSLGKGDNYVKFSSQNNKIAQFAIQASKQGKDIDTDQFIMLSGIQYASLNTYSQREIVTVTINTENRSGQRVDDLAIRYMSDGAMKIRCDSRYAREFATLSYDAQHALGRSKWHVWAVSNDGTPQSEPVMLDLTTIVGNTYSKVVIVDN